MDKGEKVERGCPGPTRGTFCGKISAATTAIDDQATANQVECL